MKAYRFSRLVLPMLLAVVAACGGGTDDKGQLPVNAKVGIEPDPAVVPQGTSVTIRVDVTGAGGEAPTAYEIDLDEALSKINITTAPCPASLGRPACQEWTIAPAADSVPGRYGVRIRTVGLSVGRAEGSFLLNVVARPAPKYGAATAVVADGDHVIVLADGLLYGQGDNGHGELGTGYLLRPFDPIPGATQPLAVSPGQVQSFVPVQADPAQRFRALATNEFASFAVDVGGHVQHWGSRQFNLGGVGPIRNDVVQFQLRPTNIDPITDPVIAVSTLGLNQIVLTSDGRVLKWGEGTPIPEVVKDRHLDGSLQTPLANVRAIAGNGNAGIFLTQDGTVREETSTPVDGLPPVVAIAVGAVSLEAAADGNRLSGIAIGDDGSVWWWPIYGYPVVPQRDTVISDATAIAVSSNGFVYALRSGDPGVWVWRLGLDTTARSIAPPAGRRFVKVAGGTELQAGQGFAILDDCGPQGGSLWRIRLTGEQFIPHAEPVPEFGVGGPNCPSSRADITSLAVAVEGSGRVISDPVAIDCGSQCAADLQTGSSVRLYAVPQFGWRFKEWREVLAGPLVYTCSYEFPVGALSSCTAVFERAPPLEVRLTVSQTGGGRLTSVPPGIACGGVCSFWFPTGSAVTLVATPTRGFRFDGFIGGAGCSNAGAGLTMDAPKTCEARFVPEPPPAAPPDFRVTIASYTSIGLAWTRSPGVLDGYLLERSSGGQPFVLAATLPFDTMDYVDSPLAAGVTYTYRLTPIGPHGSGAPAMLNAATVPGIPTVPPTDVVFEDTEFAGNTWQALVLVATPAGGPTLTAAQAPTGGNPGAGPFRGMTYSMPSGPASLQVVHLNQSAVYSPAIQGAIRSIDYREDRRLFAEPDPSRAVGAQFSMQQGERIFNALIGATTVVSGIQWTTASVIGLTAPIFVQVSGPPCSTGQTCPDFSAAGAPITLGYWRSVSSDSAASFNLTYGIDNWRVTVRRVGP